MTQNNDHSMDLALNGIGRSMQVYTIQCRGETPFCSEDHSAYVLDY